jgi:hypothetical protein
LWGSYYPVLAPDVVPNIEPYGVPTVTPLDAVPVSSIIESMVMSVVPIIVPIDDDERVKVSSCRRVFLLGFCFLRASNPNVEYMEVSDLVI